MAEDSISLARDTDIVEELRQADFTGHDSTGYVMEKAAVAIERLRAALLTVVRKGTDGRWYTSQHGDADVTFVVGFALEQDKRGTP